MTKKTGHCLCGDVTFEYVGDELWRGHCHCESCRRQTASPFTTFLGVAHGNWRWTASEPKVYLSSEGVRRFFCENCGSPMAYESEKYPQEIHFYASLLSDHSGFKPNQHFHSNEQVNWVKLDDDVH